MTTQYTKNERKEEKKLLLLLLLQRERERERERRDTTGDLGLCWAVVVKIWRLARKRDPSFLAHVFFFGLVLEKWIGVMTNPALSTWTLKPKIHSIVCMYVCTVVLYSY
jgi:hypothetical protein